LSSLFFFFFFSAAVVSSLPVKEGPGGEQFVLTPFGPVPSRCVTELPGQEVTIQNGENGFLEVKIQSTKGDLSDVLTIPPCQWTKSLSLKGPSPFVYDGWLAYTSFNYPNGFESFLGNISVPDSPSSPPQVLYTFTGLQNVNWIPVIDPLPPVFDIIQPVLQYPADAGLSWSVKSWYVTVNHGVQVTKEVVLQKGDTVFGNMTKVGEESWFIGATSHQSGKSVGLTATHPALKSQPWAYTTVECYGCTGCATEPVNPVQFTNLVLTSGGQPVTPQWKAFQSPHPICDTTAHINSPSSVTMTFGKS